MSEKPAAASVHEIQKVNGASQQKPHVYSAAGSIIFFKNFIVPPIVVLYIAL